MPASPGQPCRYNSLDIIGSCNKRWGTNLSEMLVPEGCCSKFGFRQDSRGKSQITIQGQVNKVDEVGRGHNLLMWAGFGY